MLHQRGDYEGLQVRTKDGAWVDVPIRADAFVINVGDLMAHWTNDRFPATVHRVVASTSPADARCSIVTFVLPSVDTVIAPLATTVAGDGPHYSPVTPYEWEAEYVGALGYEPPLRQRQTVAPYGG